MRLHELEFAELETQLQKWGQQPSLAREVWDWIYKRGAVKFTQMTSLPEELRRRLASEMELYTPKVLERQEDPAGEARKDLLQLTDDELIEVVLLQYGARNTVCVSTQVGCACGCPYCATGQMGYVRQLSSEEILLQVLHAQQELANQQSQFSNIVLMGMGEPMLNYDHTLAAIHRLIDHRAVGFVQRRITLSTVGIVPGIYRFAEEGLLVRLAVSLHAATDDLRSQLVPVNRHHPLDELFAAVQFYVDQTQQPVMFEWVLIDGVNDTQEQVQELVERLEGLPAHVNLIRLNTTETYSGKSSRPQTIERFSAVLDRAQIPHTMRQRRGQDIAAGCGQLRQRKRSHS
jgi:23S rRNA (adenine2503-C2)-methyltransferase